MMNAAEDFYQTFRDFLQYEAERHERTMANLADLQTSITAMKAALESKKQEDAAALASLKSSVDTALAELNVTGAAGHAAVLDKVVADQTEVIAAINSGGNAEVIKTMEADIAAAIKAMPVPSVTPVV